MHKIKQFLFSFMFIFVTGMCSAQEIKASLTAKQYHYKDSLTLVDFYFKIFTSNLRLKTEGDEDKINVSLKIEFLNDSNQIVKQKELDLITNLADLTTDYLLTRQQFVLDTGAYSLNIIMKDENAHFPASKNKIDYIVEDKKEQHFSDVFCYELAYATNQPHPLNKGGMALVPKFQNGDYLYGVNDSILSYYVEFYDLDAEHSFFMERFIRDKSNDGQGIRSTYIVKELKPIKRKIESKSIKIGDLPSGNYELVFSIFDENKKQIALKKMFFQKISRHKKKTVAQKSKEVRQIYKDAIIKQYNLNDVHRLNQIIAAMALQEEKEGRQTFYNVINSTELELKHNFFFNHWEEEDRLHPQIAIKKFIQLFDSVQDKFSHRKNDGYKTDQGRVYLEYGKPDDVEIKSLNNQSQLYEIWHYYKLKGGGGNVIFAFQNSQTEGGYRLIHSTAFGEIENPNWERILQQLNE